MPSDPIRPSDAVLRDENAARIDSVAPAGMAEARHPSPRPVMHAEEGEAGGRSEWLSLVKAVLIGAVVVMLIGRLISG